VVDLSFDKGCIGLADAGFDSPVNMLVIPINQELEIARQCFGLLGR
jgi:hypothetical protein